MLERLERPKSLRPRAHAKTLESVGGECDRRIDACRATRWHGAGQEPDHSKDDDGETHHHRIAPTDTEELRREYAAHREGHREPQPDAEADDTRRLTSNQTTRSPRHARQAPCECRSRWSAERHRRT